MVTHTSLHTTKKWTLPGGKSWGEWGWPAKRTNNVIENQQKITGRTTVSGHNVTVYTKRTKSLISFVFVFCSCLPLIQSFSTQQPSYRSPRFWVFLSFLYPTSTPLFVSALLFLAQPLFSGTKLCLVLLRFSQVPFFSSVKQSRRWRRRQGENKAVRDPSSLSSVGRKTRTKRQNRRDVKTRARALKKRADSPIDLLDHLPSLRDANFSFAIRVAFCCNAHRSLSFYYFTFFFSLSSKHNWKIRCPIFLLICFSLIAVLSHHIKNHINHWSNTLCVVSRACLAQSLPTLNLSSFFFIPRSRRPSSSSSSTNYCFMNDKSSLSEGEALSKNNNKLCTSRFVTSSHLFLSFFRLALSFIHSKYNDI